jgi:multidrug resistance efflux pump
MMTNSSIRATAAFSPTNSNTAIHLVQSSRFAQSLARILLVGLFASIAAMAFLPWQQSSRGMGSVIAYVPQERMQTVQAPVKGVVAKIAAGLVEGSEIKKGDLLIEIAPLAPNLIEQLDGQKRELQTKLESAIAKTEAYEQNVIGFTEAGEFAVSAAEEMVESAKAKLIGKRRLVTGYEAKVLQAQLNYERQKSLFDSGIKPQKEIEKLKKDWDVTKSEFESVQQEVASLINELSAKQSELEEKRRLAQTKIDYAKASQQDAIGSAATIRKEMREIDVKLAELGRLKILAPRDGTIYRMPVYEQGQTIKAGDSIVTIVPESTQTAVEIWVPGNDMPLIQIGQEVRLQFEGWPAVQVSGWPSLAIGVFSGTVVNVDATDNGKGKFRVLVLPNDKDKRIWPSDRYLRQGVRVNGWVMLRRVSLGYELWRQLNGFPVILSDDSLEKSKNKPPKIPK